ncbi:MAG: chromate transporter [Defluviitaleaceae bacterium]|nr:chromate transporter [Defluviitaleaceae bacterium]MCL2240154.1 chromate transporter [Defluviitaleaceae bacterium]
MIDRKRGQIFLAFLRSGMLCWGGGPASIPFVRREVVVRYAWMNDEEFAEVAAVGNALPGPINTKMAGYIGYKIGGIPGLALAMVGMVVPTAVLMVVLLTTLAHFADQPWAQGMTRAMVPVVGAMMAVMAWQFISIAAKGMGWMATLAQGAVVFALFWFLGLHPAIVLAGLFVWAFVGEKIRGIFRRKPPSEATPPPGDAP